MLINERYDGGSHNGTGINGKVKPTIHFTQQVLIRFVELVAHIGRYTGFNTPGRHGNYD